MLNSASAKWLEVWKVTLVQKEQKLTVSQILRGPALLLYFLLTPGTWGPGSFAHVLLRAVNILEGDPCSHRRICVEVQLHLEQLRFYLCYSKITFFEGRALMFAKICLQNLQFGASLVAQWLRVCLPMQGTRVRAVVWEDPTCRGATEPMSHNYWACASGACAPQQERPR